MHETFTFHEPLKFEGFCGWSPTQPRSVERQVHGPGACAKQKEAPHERSFVLALLLVLDLVHSSNTCAKAIQTVSKLESTYMVKFGAH
jgi:hypothetical protein